MDIFATACLGVTAVTMIAISFWIAHIASDVRRARKALEDVAEQTRSGDSADRDERSPWPSADAAA